ENSLQVLYSTYVNKCTSEPVAKFASSKIKQIQNPRPARFFEIATGFKKDWGTNLEIYVALEGRYEAINAVMDNRHLIAHGKDSNITVHRVSEYFDKIVKVAE